MLHNAYSHVFRIVGLYPTLIPNTWTAGSERGSQLAREAEIYFPPFVNQYGENGGGGEGGAVKLPGRPQTLSRVHMVVGGRCLN